VSVVVLLSEWSFVLLTNSEGDVKAIPNNHKPALADHLNGETHQYPNISTISVMPWMRA
jgi:hypothetical protein